MAWCTTDDIIMRAGTRYADALPPGDSGDFVDTLIAQAGAYIAARLAPRYTLDGSTDPGDAILQGLCADEVFYRLVSYRIAGDVIGEGESPLAALKARIEETLDLISSGRMTLSIAQSDRSSSELKTDDRLIIGKPTGWSA